MADKLIRDFANTAGLPASNDYTATDGATNGTQKRLATTIPFQTATRAALIALNTTNAGDGQVAIVQGGSSPGDGGGAIYYFSAASTATPDGSTVLQPTTGPGRWLVVPTAFFGGSTLPNDVTVLKQPGAPAEGGQLNLQKPDASALSGDVAIDVVDTSFRVFEKTGSNRGFSVNLGLCSPGNASTLLLNNNNLSELTSASTARTNLGAAASGANADITSLGAAVMIRKESVGTTEGGEMVLEKPDTSTLAGNVVLDVISQSVRIFERGGTGRGAYFDLAQCSGGASSRLLLGSNNLGDVANTITAKNNLNLVQVNVRDYGAVGNGSTDDAPAIAAAIVALPANNGWLYFPPGKYRINGGVGDIGGKTNLYISGNAAEIYNTHSGNTFVFDPTCSAVTVENIRFTGNATVRGSGIHIRCHADNVFITNCYFQGCSDFGVFIGHEDVGNVARNVYVEGNIFEETLGDGVHVLNAENVVIADNVFKSTGDDAIGIVADYSARNPKNITVTGNQIFSPASRGIAVLEATDVLLSGNQIYSASAAAIEVGRYFSTSFYNARIQVEGNKIYNSMAGGVGPRGSIWLNWIQQGACLGNQIVDPAHGAGIVFLDINEFTISGNYLRGCPQRGISTDDSTTANVAATWYQVFITNNSIDYTLANEAIYLIPASGKTIENLIVTGNNAMVTISGSFIYYDRITTGRIGNNTSISGSTISAGGSVTGVTTFNNN